MSQNYDWNQYRRDFENLDWSKGYTRDELMNRFPNIPHNWWDSFPSNQRFHSFNDFWNYATSRTGGQYGGQSGMGGTGGR